MVALLPHVRGAGYLVMVLVRSKVARAGGPHAIGSEHLVVVRHHI
jgi:hypothetical protein